MRDIVVFKKALIFRVYSFSLTLIAGRFWFGDWHLTGFQVFLIFYCTAIYYLFEICWKMAMTANEINQTRQARTYYKENHAGHVPQKESSL